MTSEAPSDSRPALRVRRLGLTPYEAVWHSMQAFTNARGPATADEIWSLQHPPVFTQGQAGRAEHVLAPGAIPVVQVDRGGQVTYHGPGQLVIYPLLDLRRLGLGVRELVTLIEQAIIEVLARYELDGQRREDAPGVYVDGAKIAALGLRVRRGCSFHGLAFNLSLDLEPFARINPCGYEGLAVTRLVDLVTVQETVVEQQLLTQLALLLGYNKATEHLTAPWTPAPVPSEAQS